jgi:hypothetical protein
VTSPSAVPRRPRELVQSARDGALLQVEHLQAQNGQLLEFISQLKMDKSALALRLNVLEQQSSDLIAENLKLTAQLLSDCSTEQGFSPFAGQVWDPSRRPALLQSASLVCHVTWLGCATHEVP